LRDKHWINLVVQAVFLKLKLLLTQQHRSK